MATINSKQKQGLQALIDIFKQKDHWVGLDNIVEEAEYAATNIDKIANSFEEIAENRRELPAHLVRLMVFIEIAKVKLSIMPEEWNENVDREVDIMIKEHKPNFDDMEF